MGLGLGGFEPPRQSLLAVLGRPPSSRPITLCRFLVMPSCGLSFVSRCTLTTSCLAGVAGRRKKSGPGCQMIAPPRRQCSTLRVDGSSPLSSVMPVVFISIRGMSPVMTDLSNTMYIFE